MGLFGEVKCGRCDRRYSAIRSRCPYCGARKRRSGKSSGYGDNRWQVVAGFILLIIIVLAVAILVFKNINAGKPKPTPAPSPKVTTTGTPKQTDTPTPTPPSTAQLPAATPAPGVKVTSIVLTRQDFTLANIGETWVLGATVSPSNASQIVNWTSDDPKIAKVSSDGRVTAVSAGTATVTAEAGGVKASCMVRVIGSGTVSTPSGNSSGSSSGMSLNRDDLTLDATSKEIFTLKVNGASSTPTFSGGSSGVATIDAGGTIKAVAPGTTTVYATVGGVKLECIVRVVNR